MMNCFVCSCNFENYTIFMDHLKNTHYLGNRDAYFCGKCKQHFNFKSYKKHILKHFNISSAENKQQEIPIINQIPSTTKIDAIKTNVTDTHNPICFNAGHESSDFNSSENAHTYNIDNIFQKITESALKFSLSLHATTNLSRNDVFEIQKKIVLLITTPILKSFEQFLNHHYANQIDLSLRQLLNICSNPFESMQSNYKFFKILEKFSLYESPLNYTIDNKIGLIHLRGEASLGEKKTKGVILPLKFQFRNFFEKENRLEEAIQDIQKLLSIPDYLSNFVQGDLWKQKIMKYGANITIPYFLYIDDLQINNPLGSHAKSIASIYY